MSKQVEVALDLLDLKPGQTLLELGSGDGRVLRAGAKRGLYVVGIELNPLLVIFSRIWLIKYRRNTKVIWGSYWSVSWPQCDGVFTFMMDRYMPKLDKRMNQLNNRSIKLASYAFKIPGKKPLQQKAGVLLYEYGK